MSRQILKTFIAALLGVSLLLAGGCGKASENKLKVGPIGPTSPGGYYYDLMVTPSVISVGGTFTAVVHVTDASGNPVNGTVTTPALGINFSGDSLTSGSTAAVNELGVAGLYVTFSGTVSGGGTTYITAQFENLTLTAPVALRP